MGVNEKLLAVQAELKAPKNQYNSFGKYKYRSCEDILEGVKPVFKKYNASLFISDSIETVGERYYVKATATFIDVETGESIINTAFARESADKKGMDDSQVTGATSSYARKYALNGLFLIDDTKDADTNEYTEQQTRQSKKKTDKTPQNNVPTEDQMNQTQNYPPREEMLNVAKSHYPDGSDALNSLLKLWNINSLDKATDAQLMVIFNKYNKVN